MSTAQPNLWWCSDAIDQPLAEALDSLVKRLGANHIEWSYLEWRPGSNLNNQGRAPILTKGAPDHAPKVALDEVRLFSDSGGLHAIEDAGRTRWMQWRTTAFENSAAQSPWKAEQVSVEEGYQIQLLDNQAARRFGLAQNALPLLEKMWITEYRQSGELFCWNLIAGAS